MTDKKMNLEALYKIKDKYLDGEIDRAVVVILHGDADNVNVMADALYLPETEYGGDAVNEFNVATGKTVEFVTKDLAAYLYSTFHTKEGLKGIQEAKELQDKANPKPQTKPALSIVE